MFIREKAVTPNGVDIQIEDWSDTYPNLYELNDVIGFYPVAKVNSVKEYGPQKGYTFRCSFKFANETECKEAFDNLKNGVTTFEDYKKNFDTYPDYYECLYGEER